MTKALPPRTDSELAKVLERGNELPKRGSLPSLPEILRRCAHPPGKIRVTARGAHSVILMCQCGAGTLALVMPARPLSKMETEAIIGLAREASW